MAPKESLISIIIPVYNVERYIDACLRSVTTQTHDNLEIILVDDGATDNSGDICDDWAKKDSRIKVVHKKNEGLNFARKSGWEIATGSHVTFLDSDDMIHPDTIRNTLAILAKEEVDMVAFMYLEFSDKDEEEGSINPELSQEYDIKRTTADAFKLLICNGYGSLYPMTAWGKLYKRELIESVDWKKSNMRAYEDNFFTPQIFDNVKSFVVVKQQLYFYRRNDTGVVLSRMLIDNSLNGTPVGYLEYMSLMRSYWQSFLDKHNITELNKEFDDFCHTNEVFRLNNLIEANLLCAENNCEFAGDIIKKMQSRLDKNILEKNRTIDSQRQQITNFEQEIDGLKLEITKLHTTKGAIQNVARSIKNTATSRHN